jgi:hypothetical protein
LNDVEQLIDSLQIHRGNPELKMPTICNNTLNIDYRKGLSGSNLHLPYQYQQTPAMGCPPLPSPGMSASDANMPLPESGSATKIIAQAL